MAVPLKNCEPLTIAAGDTIYFSKSLQDYPASQGWALKYELRGGAQAIEWNSTPSGDSHVITVAASVTATWLPAEYQLTGYAENAGTGERKQVYFNYFPVTPNVEASQGDLTVETHAQKMVRLIEAVQEGRATHDILESEIESTRIKRLSPMELRDEYIFWLNKRNEEIHVAAVKAGKQSKRTVYMQFSRPSSRRIH